MDHDTYGAIVMGVIAAVMLAWGLIMNAKGL
jgi:hypothetical protein